MDQRVDADDLAQPEIEGDIGMARRQVRVVIARLAVEAVAAVGLDRGDELAVTGEAQGELAVADGRIVLRRAPGGHDLVAGAGVEAGEQAPVVVERQERRGRGVAQRGTSAA